MTAFPKYEDERPPDHKGCHVLSKLVIGESRLQREYCRMWWAVGTQLRFNYIIIWRVSGLIYRQSTQVECRHQDQLDLGSQLADDLYIYTRGSLDYI